jgi:hypothetical protein
MSSVLNAAVTADAYTAGNTLKCVGAVRVNFEIRNAEIFYQFAYRYPGQPAPASDFNGPEVRAGRTLRSLDRNIDAVRVRSAVAGTPATVTIEAMLPEEIG